MEIHVTQEHIDKGVADDCCLCPIALAISDVVLPTFYPQVSNIDLSIFEFGHKIRIRIALPNECRTFVYNFDDDHEVYPFSFEIDIPHEFLRI